MGVLVTIIAVTLLAGCTVSTQNSTLSFTPSAETKLMPSPLQSTEPTVADVITMLAAGKPPEDIRPLLGIPVMSGRYSKYALQDGWISTDFRHYLMYDGSHQIKEIASEQKN